MRAGQLLGPLSALGVTLVAGAVDAHMCEGSAQAPCQHEEPLQLAAGATSTLQGAHIYPDVEIAGALSVIDHATGAPTSGWVHIRSKRIHIAAGGSITADGSGYSHVGLSMDGEGVTLPPPGNLDLPQPGGGGAHVGAGGQGRAGVDQTAVTCPQPFPGNVCDLFALADGGAVYDLDPATPLALGSDPQLGMGRAGGGSHSGCPNGNSMIFPGASGGGVIILTAQQVIIDGVLTANGLAGQAIAASGTGAGAGGSIIVQALDLQSSATALLSARGGDGFASMSDVRNSIGGGGGGGLIVVQAPNATSALSNTDVRGGRIDACVGVSAGEASGQAGIAVAGSVPACIDADLDGFTVCANARLTLDCDDGRDFVSPDGCERCEGALDEDCDGDPDNTPADDACAPLCPLGSGLTCANGSCAPGGGGGGTPSGSTGGDPPALELGGGLCASAGALGLGGDRLAWLGLGLLALVAALRRRR